MCGVFEDSCAGVHLSHLQIFCLHIPHSDSKASGLQTKHHARLNIVVLYL